MRIRLPFAGTFLLLCLLAGYAGLSSVQLGAYVNDKVLHLATFFLLTAVFYWIVDTGRRRALHLTSAICTLAGGVGSEFLQAWVPDNGREFDPADVAANLLGSGAALGLCAWYHRRMLERRRLAARAARYNPVPGEDDEDLELGEGPGPGLGLADGHEEGVTTAAATAGVGAGAGARATTLESEVDQWDENALDSWDEEDDEDDDEDDNDGNSHGVGAPVSNTMGESNRNGVGTTDKKRVD
ncbi:hypothetical protein SLS62_011122 [Diatrype stigma]|uniref:VanZ-like domain-containing protein n=1 Tax=Diatrype stigma TaxID=117547 RepID=A0AAN9YGC9_9PEZI